MNEVKLFAGPKHGMVVRKEGEIPNFLTIRGGYYTRVTGGKSDEYYWHDGPVPMGVHVRGVLRPVQKVNHAS